MPTSSSTELDRLVHLSRRQLWCALSFILLLGTDALVTLALPDSPAALMAQKMSAALPVIIIVALAALRMAAPSKAGLTALRDDELRQASLRKAYANGFAATLIVQPALAPLLTALGTPNGVAAMAGATALAGALVFLGSLLYHDR